MVAENDLKRMQDILLRQRLEIFQSKQQLESNWDALSEREIEMEETAQKTSLTEIYQQLDEQEQQEIEAIDLALDKIDDNTYGICDGCRQTIPTTRLALLPATPYYITCSLKTGKEPESSASRHLTGQFIKNRASCLAASQKKRFAMGQKMGRRDRLIKEERHDAYREKGKLPEPTVCRECGAVFLEGRWTWWEAAAKSHVVVCPACQRTNDKFPAGYLEITGTFFDTHREEIDNLISNLEKREKADHPMERIMAISAADGHTLITTTGIHLARRIGEALKHAYQGELDFTYGDGEKSIRLIWNRP